MQLRTNRIPKALIPLDNLFEHDEKSKVTPKSNVIDDPFFDIKVDTKESPRLVKLGKACSPNE